MAAIQITRRKMLKASLASATAAALAPTMAEQTPPPPRPRLHDYPTYEWLRGFTVVPSWGARIEEAWWNYQPDLMRQEVALARSVHANCIRLWIEFTAWMADPDRVTARFLDAVAAIDESGMKVMPCLFNRWHDARFDYGGIYTENLLADWQPQLEYVRALATPLKADPRVLIWDLCNEPQAFDLNGDRNQREFAWLKAVADTLRTLGVQQPITIGTMVGANISTYAPLVDVLCGHPYAHDPKGLNDLVAGFRTLQRAHNKPFMVNECIPGSLDDAVRAKVTRFYTETLAAAGYGWMGWALREGKAISTRRDRYDANGVNGQGFHPFFTRDGKLRDGLDFLKEKPAKLAPWEKAPAA